MSEFPIFYYWLFISRKRSWWPVTRLSSTTWTILTTSFDQCKVDVAGFLSFLSLHHIKSLIGSRTSCCRSSAQRQCRRLDTFLWTHENLSVIRSKSGLSSVSGWAAWDEPAILRAARWTAWSRPEEETRQRAWRKRRRRASWRPPPGRGWWRCCAGWCWWSTGCLWCGRRRGQTGVPGTAAGNTAPPPWWCWSPRYSDTCGECPDLFREDEKTTGLRSGFFSDGIRGSTGFFNLRFTFKRQSLLISFCCTELRLWHKFVESFELFEKYWFSIDIRDTTSSQGETGISCFINTESD